MKITGKFPALLLLLAEIYSVTPRSSDPEQFQIQEFGREGYLRGAIHVHSKHSKGSGDIPSIAHAASDAGLQFVIITDENSSEGRKDEGTHFGVDTFVDLEVTTPAGHALLFYSHTEAKNLKEESLKELAWKHYQGKETVKDLFLVAAHPSHPRHPWNSLDRFPDGIEISSFDAEWEREVEQSLLGTFATALVYPFNNFLSALRFLQINPKDLTVWDAMNAVSPGKFGLVSVDARAKVKLTPNRSVSWPSYRKSFVLAQNILFYDPPLAGNFEERRTQIYQSLKNGRSAIVYPLLHPYAGNQWSLSCPSRIYRVGETAPYDPDCEFRLELPSQLPYPAIVRLFRQGELTKEWKNARGKLETKLVGPGTYRAEVWLSVHSRLYLLLSKDVPYVLYNPIYVK